MGLKYKKLNENILKELVRLKGSSKHKTSDEQLHKAREKAFEELETKFRMRLSNSLSK